MTNTDLDRDEPFRVTREKIREFAAALGERNPICHDVAAARLAGYADLVAPPTFLISMQMNSLLAFLASPEVGLDISQILHGEQGFVLQRPVIAGDELLATTNIVDTRTRGDATFYSLETQVAGKSGQSVARLNSTIVGGSEGSAS
jgi:acyl dehydratase